MAKSKKVTPEMRKYLDHFLDTKSKYPPIALPSDLISIKDVDNNILESFINELGINVSITDVINIIVYLIKNKNP